MIATFYDIHGNLAALDAVLAEVPDEATIVVGGDISSGGPEPAGVLERLRALGDWVLWGCAAMSVTRRRATTSTSSPSGPRRSASSRSSQASARRSSSSGHAHTQFERTVGGIRVINSGSVGIPYEDRPGA